MTPCRIADTRIGSGPFGGPELAAGASREFDIPNSACNIPSTAVAYSLNVTVVPNASLDYLTLWPAGQTQPNVSTLNSLDGRIKANAAIVPAGTNGGVSVYVSDATNVILDIDGYFVPSGTANALTFYPLTPCRIADTRQATGPLGAPFISGGSSRTFPVQSSSCTIPSTAKAYSLNVTAVPHKTLNYLTSWPTGETQPNVSTLNAPTGAITANAAIVPAGTSGDISVFVSDDADVILDVNGYFAPPGTGGLSLYTVTPCRVIDTRLSSGAFNGMLLVDVEASTCAPPSTARAYILNATVVPPASLDYLTLWPAGEAQPNVSTLNALDGAITSNMAILPVVNGTINAFSSNSTQLILDISSYFAPTLAATATPSLSPAAGTYTSAQTVSIADATQDAVIYYTTDGTVPTTVSSVYTEPIAVSSSETLKAIALAPGYAPSSVATAVYTITLPTATPEFTPPAGTYTSAQMVTISDATSSAVIYYTTNGTTPTTTSPKYTAAINVSSSETLQAIAVAPSYTQSAVATATYTITPPAATPVFSPAAGTYAGTQTVTVTGATPGSVIYYTTDRTTPTTSSTKYTGAITISSSEALEAIAVATGYAQSATALAAYTITSATPSEIVTIAGNGTIGYGGDGGLATAAALNNPGGIARDAAGNVYIADSNNNRIRKVAAGTFTITTVAGNGTAGHTGDGGAATSAELNSPAAVAVDSAGNLYIADLYNNLIRKVAAGTGTITTLAGGGTPSSSLGDGGPATSAFLNFPIGVAVDSAGNVYIADLYDSRIRKVTASTGIITTLAGTYVFAGSTGDGGPATSAGLYLPWGVAVDNAGNVYIADYSRIREVFASTGFIFTVAGDGGYGYSGDGGPATSAAMSLDWITGIAVDSAGNIYFTDSDNNRVREVTASTGIISTVAGSSVAGYAGDGGPATSAELNFPDGVAVDSAGNIYISDSDNGVIREVSTNPPQLTHYVATPAFSVAPGTYFAAQTVALTDVTAGSTIYYTLDGTTPTTSSTKYTQPITVSASSTIEAIAVATGYQQSAIATGAYSITAVTSPEIVTIAGDGYYGYTGDGGIATAAELATPESVIVDKAGNIYISNLNFNVIRKVSASTGVITTVAGNGTGGYSGDGGPATSATLNFPQQLAIDSVGNLYIADSDNCIIRMVSAATGIITTVAGIPGECFVGADGGAATSTGIGNPIGVAVDSSGNILISDGFSRVRKVTAATGIITTVAGNGTRGYSGDGGAATSAEIFQTQIAVDSTGNLYISDTNNQRVRKVMASTGIITTVAGNGTSGYSGDGGPATSSELNYPEGIGVDIAGNIYIADSSNARIRKVTASTGVISTIAGTGVLGYTGDEGPATAAEMYQPFALAVDSSGSIYASDASLEVVREISTAPHLWGRYSLPPYFTPSPGTYDGSQVITIIESIDSATLNTPVTIYYTMDGTTPTTASTVYTGPITITSSKTFKAIAVAPGYSTSAVATGAYTIQSAAAATPVIWLPSGTYTGTQMVPITDATAGSTIYYTTDGTIPTTSSLKYAGAITVSSSATVTAIAVASGYSNSAIAYALYDIVPPPAPPTLTSLYPGGGPLNTAATVQITGTGFTPSSTVAVNGAQIASTYINPTEITATLLASSLTFPGNVNITVTAPAGTSAPISYTVYLGITNNDIAYNPTDGLLYASVPFSSLGAPGNSVVGIDPVTGNVKRQIWVGSNPNKLAISTDGTQLFVGLDGAAAVAQVDLTQGKVVKQFSLGGGQGVYNPPSTAQYLAPVPGSPNSVAVAETGGYAGGSGIGVAIFDSGVARANTSTNFGSGPLSFGSSASTLYMAASGIQELTIGPSGITAATTLSNNYSNVSWMQYDNGRLYLSTGAVLDASSGALLGTFYSTTSTAANGPVVSDPTLGKAFIGVSNFSNNGQVFAFDENTFNQLGSISVNGVGTQGYPTNFTKIVRWGQNGLALSAAPSAFSSTNQLFIFQSPLVKDVSSSPADLSVKLVAPIATTTGTAVPWVATVKNQGPNSSQGATLAMNLDSSLIINSVTASQGSCGTDTTFACDLGNLANGASVTVTVSAIPTTSGTLAGIASVTSTSYDPTLTNNQSTTSTTATGTVYGEVPDISAISPNLVQAGSGGFTLSVTGTGFNPDSTVKLGTTPLPTTYVSAAQLTASVTASQIANYGWAPVTVSNPMPGGGLSQVMPLTIYDVANVPASGILFDPYSQLLYATLPSTATTLTGNSVVTINPVTGAVGTPVLVGSQPTVMAETSDGNYLYIGLSGADSVAQFDLLRQSLKATIPISMTQNGSTTSVAATWLAAMPGSDSTLAINTNGTWGNFGIFDVSGNTGSFRPNFSGIYSGVNPIFGDASQVYAYDSQTSGAEFYRYSVDANGLTLIDGTTLDGLGGFSGSIQLAKGLAYGASGGIINPSTTPPSQVASLPLFGGYGYADAPDPSLQKQFLVLEDLAGTSTYGLVRYDLNTYLPEAWLDMPASIQPLSTMLRFGQDGLALLSSAQNSSNQTVVTVVLLRGPFIAPQELETNPAVSLTSSSATTIAHGSGNTILTLTGSNFLPGVAVTWNGSYRTTTIIDATHLTVAIPASDLANTGTASLVATNPGAGGSNALQIVIN